MTEPKEYKWNLSELYNGDDDPRIQADVEAARAAATAFAAKWRSRDDYLTDAAVLGEALADYEQLAREHGVAARPSYYLWLRRTVDQNNNDLKAKTAVVEKAVAEISNQLKFFELKLGQTKPADQPAHLAGRQIAPYKYWLSRIYEQAKYNFNEQTEQVLEMIEPQATRSWIDMIEEILSAKSVRVWDGAAETEHPFNSALEMLKSPDLKVVDSVGQAINATLDEVAPLAEREINAVVTTYKRETQLRGFDTPERARYVGDGLKPEVAEVMMSAIEKRYDLPRRYYALMAKILGQDKLKYWQRSVTLGQIPAGYSFQKAIDSVARVLGNLDPDFSVKLHEALKKGYIDADVRPGKSGGAFCAYTGLNEPNYLMLNFTGGLRDVETLAHEFGHYLNFVYMKEECNGLNYGVPTPLAEITSTFNEKYIMEELLTEADDETRLSIMLSTLSSEAATIFRQTAAMRFEQELYREIDAKGYLSHEQIGRLFVKHMEPYMGDAVEQSEGAGNWWIYWSHLRTLFYNYSYSFAFLVAKALQVQVDSDPAFITEYKRLLRAGLRYDPQELLKSMGLDITTEALWNKGIDAFEDSLNEAEALAKKLGKIK
jgi:oligoendopeptidase F